MVAANDMQPSLYHHATARRHCIIAASLAGRGSTGGDADGSLHLRLAIRAQGCRVLWIPSSAKRLKQAAGGEQFRQPHLDQRIFRGEEGLLGLQHRDEIDGAAAQLRLCDIERLAGSRHHFGLQPFLQRILLKRDKRLFDIRECRENGFAISLQILQLQALRLLQLAFQQKAIEDRLGQTRGQRVIPGTGPEQRGKRGALRTGLTR